MSTKKLSHQAARGTLESMRTVCSFWLNQKFYGVSIYDILEIRKVDDICPIPLGPAPVRGYVNIRSQIYLVLDLVRILEPGSSGTEIRKGGMHLIVFKERIGENFGILVDKLGEVLNISEAQIEYASDLGHKQDPGLHPELVLGVCKLKTNLLVLLESKRFLDSV